MNTLVNVTPPLGDNHSPSRIGFAADAPPKSGIDGVSTNRALQQVPKEIEEDIHWYTLRATYGREKKAYEYIVAQGVEAFYPTMIVSTKDREGKRVRREVSLLPNIFFIHTTETIAKSYVFENKTLHYLRFYYNVHHDGSKEPLIVPDQQMSSLQTICAAHDENILLVPNEITKFSEGQLVRIIDGAFSGVVGRVARYHGQQRVGVVVDGILTLATAYVPSACLEIIE